MSTEPCYQCQAEPVWQRENDRGDIVCLRCNTLLSCSSDFCRECGADASYIEEMHGEQVCTQCGVILNQVLYQGPGRRFHDDHEKRADTDIQYYNPCDYKTELGTDSTCFNYKKQTETQIRDTISQLFSDGNADLYDRALTYCKRLFEVQDLAKKGLSYKVTSRCGVPVISGGSVLDKPKRKYSGGKKIVAASIFQALRDSKVTNIPVSQYTRYKEKDLIIYIRRNSQLFRSV